MKEFVVDDDTVSDNTDTTDHSDLTDSTGYSSDEDYSMFSVVNPMIVVSNRLPFVLKRDDSGSLKRQPRYLQLLFCQNIFFYQILFSAGGLVTAVAPVVVECDGLWVGWTGLQDYHPASDSIPDPCPDDLTPTAGLKSSNIVPVTLDSSSMFDQYYNGCCNATFWPLFHSMPDRAVFNIETWTSYSIVNKQFAETTLEAIRRQKDSSRLVMSLCIIIPDELNAAKFQLSGSTIII